MKEREEGKGGTAKELLDILKDWIGVVCVVVLEFDKYVHHCTTRDLKFKLNYSADP